MRQSRRLGRLDRTSVATPIVDILLKHREWRDVPIATSLPPSPSLAVIFLPFGDKVTSPPGGVFLSSELSFIVFAFAPLLMVGLLCGPSAMSTSPKSTYIGF
jgi:hypothetical protein